MEPSGWRQIFSGLALFGQLGLTVVSGGALGGALGHAIDRGLGDSRLATLVGIVVGILAGAWSAWKLVARELDPGPGPGAGGGSGCPEGSAPRDRTSKPSSSP